MGDGLRTTGKKPALRARRMNADTSGQNWYDPSEAADAQDPFAGPRPAQSLDSGATGKKATAPKPKNPSPLSRSSIARVPTILAPQEAGTSGRHKTPDRASIPDPLSDSGKRRTLMDGATGRRAAVRPAPRQNEQSRADVQDDWDEPDTRGVPMRTREQNAARPLSQLPGTLKLPTIREDARAPQYVDDAYDDAADGGQDWEQEWDAQVEDEWDRYAEEAGGHELVPVPQPGYVSMPLSADSIPNLAAFRPAVKVKPRKRVNTQMLIEKARSPWSITRAALAIVVMVITLVVTVGVMGEPSQGLMTAFAASAGGTAAPSVASRVQPETQMKRPDLYDNYQQFLDWGDADCSAATASEVLTAWGVQGATIGKLIDAMQPDISLNGGLLRMSGFQRGVSHFGYRADIRNNLSYNQLLYITHTLGLPVIVNVRISYGYFHFFSGGHFLVMTDGDSQGLRIVDSSEYYITYLPRDVFYSMFTGITAVIVPNGYTYDIPNL
jgi:hypothetical protein